jgi:hypothetical protein
VIESIIVAKRIITNGKIADQRGRRYLLCKVITLYLKKLKMAVESIRRLANQLHLVDIPKQLLVECLSGIDHLTRDMIILYQGFRYTNTSLYRKVLVQMHKRGSE